MKKFLIQSGVLLQGERRRTQNAGVLCSFSMVLFLLPLLFAETAYGDINSNLREAAAAGNTVEVEQLLGKGADVNAEREDGRTALQSAAFAGHTETVKALIDAGADVNAKDDNDWPVLMSAAAKGRTETVKALIDAGADVNAGDDDATTALMIAAIEGHTETVKALIDARVDVNAKDNIGNTALTWAAKLGHTEIGEILKQAGAQAEMTVSGGINIELAKAVDAGNTAKVEQLLKQGADVNGKNEDGASALMMYALMGRTETVKALIDVGADINAKTNSSQTALQGAASKGHTETVKALIDAGADINAKDDDGQTVLMSAAFAGHTAPVKALVDAGVDVNAGVENDRTAMKIAVLLGHTKIVEILKQAGATPAIDLERRQKEMSDYEALYDVVSAGEFDEIQVFVVVNNLKTGELITKKVEKIGCTSLEIVEYFRDQGGLSKNLFDELAGLNNIYEKHQSRAYEKIIHAEGATIGRLIRCVDEDIFLQNVVDDFYLRERKWYDFLFDNS